MLIRGESGAMAVSQDLYTFTVEGASGVVPSPVHGATGSTGWPFKRIQAGDSTLVLLAKVLPVSNLIC